MRKVYVVVTNPPEVGASYVGGTAYTDRADAEATAEKMSFATVKELEVRE